MSARALLSLSVSGVLLAWALSRVAGSTLSLRELRLGWLALGALCTAPAFAAVAWRWSAIARRLGLELPFSRALPEVYAAALLNGLLPSGMAGDALRAVRHGRALAADARERSDGGAPAREIGRLDLPSLARGAVRFDARALLAVALERVSGQVVLWSALLFGLAWWPSGEVPVAAFGFGSFGVMAVGALLVFGRRAAASSFVPRASALAREAHTALIAGGAWRGQLFASALVIGGCAASFACSACALGAPVSGTTLLRVVPPLLAVTALPLSIGGFGVREFANGALYAAAGLDADTGIAVAAVYGVAGLIGSLPGALCLWLRRKDR